MRKIVLLTACGLGAALMALVGCGSSGSAPDGGRGYSATNTDNWTSYDLLAGQTTLAGHVLVNHNETTLVVRFETQDGWKLNGTHLDIEANCASVPQTRTGNPIPGKFKYKRTYSPAATSDSYTISMAAYGFRLTDPVTCIAIAAHADLSLLDGNGAVVRTETGWGDGEPFPGANWGMCMEYCLTRAPDITDQDLTRQFRTQTQGGWGAEAHGGNQGAYRDAHFGSAFPGGLTVGCPTGDYTLRLTSSAAVEAYLPDGGTAEILTQNYTDPTLGENEHISVLAGQAVALTLNVGFDLTDPSFSANATNLKDLVVADSASPFYGWTVQQVLSEANLVLGGCGGTHTPAEVNEAASAINENFDDGVTDVGFLRLP
ncbi:MAG: hypothetical protein HYU66_18230 [Armatimonadetes bacterium]|nr:hypothetical protein [Armatimonadota bacterium]